MGSKVGVLLSLLFVLQVLLFGGDLSNIQIIHSELDALATHVAQRIGYDGMITEETIEYVLSYPNTYFQCLENCAPHYGDTVVFVITRDFQPLIIQKEKMTIAVKRSTVIGYYN
ncbi:MAG: hypothetical protein ACOX3K_00205 [Bacilli bacterium]|jgi:hypothetical protein